MNGPAADAKAHERAPSPLAHPVFRALWIANVVSMVGTWMHEVGAGWLMTSLTPDPFLVSLVQAATTLPAFLLALPGGALADIFDRRRLLLATQAWACLVAGCLGALTLAGTSSAGVLLAFTFALGVGTALTAPAWLAVISELVPPSGLPAAVTLNGVAMNVSRALGPALGGLVIAAAGPGWAFLLNSVSYLGVVVVLFRWDRPRARRALPAERLFGAVRAGLRYVRHAPAFRAVLWRGGAFILPASAFWALLPLFARAELGQGPEGYGLMVGSVGLGAVLGGTALPKLRRRDRRQLHVPGAWLLFALTTASLSELRLFPLVCLVLGLTGVAWISLLSSLNTSAQLVVPAWVRGRAVAVYLIVFFGGMAAGSPLWGKVARATSTPTALALASAGLVVGLLATWRLPLSSEGEDLTPSLHWGELARVPEELLDRGPVVVSVDYRIDPEALVPFRAAMREMRRIRLRDGAMRWELYSDPDLPGRYLETFVIESWVEHLRQHQRITVADRKIEDLCHSFHRGEGAPKVTHYIAEPVPRRL